MDSSTLVDRLRAIVQTEKVRLPPPPPSGYGGAGKPDPTSGDNLPLKPDPPAENVGSGFSRTMPDAAQIRNPRLLKALGIEDGAE